MATASTSPTNRFVPLSTHHLSTQSPQFETTLPSLLERSEQLAEEAREALPYSFDECTYNKGYLRQSVWSCIDCGEKGVCYGCSISCHADHKLVELWTRRHFRCDCPTTAMPETNGKRKKCTLNPPHAQPQQDNEENRYGPNYSGKFCRCGREYDAETEIEAMLKCIGCEDWYHESCLNLLPLNPKSDEPLNTATDEEDEEKESLIPSETYDGLICAACVAGHPVLKDRAGSTGWMMIVPKEDGGFEVLGRPSLPTDTATKVELADEKDVKPSEDPIVLSEADRAGTAPPKRSAEDHLEEESHSVKKARPSTPGVKPEPNHAGSPTSGGAGDVFLAHGEREKLKSSLTPEVAASLPFPLEDEEIYEPPQDVEQEETLDEVTDRVVGSLPRVQAIEALHGYQVMKDKLKTMLATHAQDGSSVSREDIESFFAQLQAARR